MRYSLVIFNLDGTLADSFPWFLGQLGASAAYFSHFACGASLFFREMQEIARLAET